MIHITKNRIYYSDTDAGGVVYYANFLKYAEHARADLFRGIGVELRKLQMCDHYGFIVKKSALEIFSPLFLDDLMRIETTISKMGNIKIFFNHKIFNDTTNAIVASIEAMIVGIGENEESGDEQVVLSNPVLTSDNFMPKHIPKNIVEKLKTYCE